MRYHILTLALGLGVLFTGCGGGGSSPDTQIYPNAEDISGEYSLQAFTIEYFNPPDTFTELDADSYSGTLILTPIGEYDGTFDMDITLHIEGEPFRSHVYGDFEMEGLSYLYLTDPGGATQQWTMEQSGDRLTLSTHFYDQGAPYADETDVWRKTSDVSTIPTAVN